MTLTKEQEKEVTKLAQIGRAATALKKAAELNKVTIDELKEMVVSMAKREQEKENVLLLEFTQEEIDEMDSREKTHLYRDIEDKIETGKLEK